MCSGEQCFAQVDKYSESDEYSSPEWETFLSDKVRETNKKLNEMGLHERGSIKKELIKSFKARSIHTIADAKPIVELYISQLVDHQLDSRGGGKRRKKYSKKKKKSKKKKGKSKRKRSKTRRRR
jgi:hypothetical protein